MKLKQNRIVALISSIALAISIIASSAIMMMNYDPTKNLVTEANAAGKTYGKASRTYQESSTWGASVFTFKNTEDATKISAFDNNYRLQNIYKMWSVFREMGMNEYQACAALGSAACEGLFYSEMIEYSSETITLADDIKDEKGNIKKAKDGTPLKKGTTVYTSLRKLDKNGSPVYEAGGWVYELDKNGNRIDNDPFTGSHSHRECGGKPDFESARDAYIERWSSKIGSGKSDYLTRCTDDSMRSYGITENSLKMLHNPEYKGPTIYVGPNEHVSVKVNASFYYNKGIGYTGCGFYGFTGTVLDRLFTFAEELGTKWYDADTQLAFLVSKTGYNNGPYSINKYIENTKDEKNFNSVEACEKVWYKTISGGAYMSDEHIAARAKCGEALYEMLCAHSKDRDGYNGWDHDYAQKILKKSGNEVISTRDGIQDRGILEYYSEPAVLYPQNSGFILDNEFNEDMKKNNAEVFTGQINAYTHGKNTSNAYSLYELYGEDIHWYRYFGEATYTPTLLDHIWSAYDQDKLNYLKFSDIWYDAYNYLSCQVYPGRPQVLSKGDIENGDTDPRVLALSNGRFNGYSYVSGSINFAIAKFFVSTVSFLASDGILEIARQMLEKLEKTDVFDVFRVLIMIILGFAMCGFIISLVKKGVQYAKGTGSSMKDVIERFLIGVICLGFLFAGMANPKILNDCMKNTAGLVTGIFSEALKNELENDEVVAVQDEKKAIPAALWKTAIFNCWCRGQFNGLEYNQLYTQYANIDKDQSKMPQSHEKVDRSKPSDTPFYDSVSLTGDVYVPVGGGKEIRNWAAYLYSCGSKYHIDSTLDKKKAATVDTTDLYFPHYTLVTTANNPSLAADTFRVIDAQMNISPQYFASGNEVNNYKDSNELETNYYSESVKMLFNCALLLFLVPVIYKKIMAFILLMATIFKLIYFTILELFKEKEGLPDFMKSIKKHFFDFFGSCLKLCLMVFLYYKFVDQGFFKTVIYCVLCVVILIWNWKDTRSAIYNTRMKIKNYRARM